MKRSIVVGAWAYLVGMVVGLAIGYRTAKAPVSAVLTKGEQDHEAQGIVQSFGRTIKLETFPSGGDKFGALTLEAKSLPESERMLVERSAQHLWEMHRQGDLVGKDIDVLNSDINAATKIYFSGSYTRFGIDWDASSGNTDLCACFWADLKTGKILSASFLASDGRWSK